MIMAASRVSRKTIKKIGTEKMPPAILWDRGVSDEEGCQRMQSESKTCELFSL